MAPIRVFLVDDSKEFVQFTRALLAEFPRVQVIGSADSAEEALPLLEQTNPDLVLMDLAMRGMNGLKAVQLLKAKAKPPRVIVVSGSDLPAYRQAAFEVGADGFLSKTDLFHGLAPLLDGFFGNGVSG